MATYTAHLCHLFNFYIALVTRERAPSPHDDARCGGGGGGGGAPQLLRACVRASPCRESGWRPRMMGLLGKPATDTQYRIFYFLFAYFRHQAGSSPCAHMAPFFFHDKQIFMENTPSVPSQLIIILHEYIINSFIMTLLGNKLNPYNIRIIY